MTPSAFIFLYENQLFLTFRNRTVAVWNFRGELVTSFEDHLLWHPDCNTNNIYITSDQDLIISYCKADSVDSDDSVTEGNGNLLIHLLDAIFDILVVHVLHFDMSTWKQYTICKLELKRQLPKHEHMWQMGGLGNGF